MAEETAVVQQTLQERNHWNRLQSHSLSLAHVFSFHSLVHWVVSVLSFSFFFPLFWTINLTCQEPAEMQTEEKEDMVSDHKSDTTLDWVALCCLRFRCCQCLAFTCIVFTWVHKRKHQTTWNVVEVFGEYLKVVSCFSMMLYTENLARALTLVVWAADLLPCRGSGCWPLFQALMAKSHRLCRLCLQWWGPHDL